ncbi:hypothetical protein HFRIS_015781 [Herbaspirillum frisingense GSF30]|uniref:DUF4259 domain-containing protein n=1 Tax=Herbaspirillum frisingense GSF30 TaxID=864073 RepID=A0AAI9N303_9BURK|nr:DUF4259 domain-containing protein [Herbaspirillum frisingense]EOA03832.1 hypothetical protein HFRIS_015781 [Herbaspirillum frisingense GSF30]
MGAWSYEPFGNDDACDWIAQLKESNDLGMLDAVFDVVLSFEGSYLEVTEACEAIAAAEVLARLLGNYGTGDAGPEAVNAWIKRVEVQPPTSLLAKANLALERIGSGPSELKELWAESDDVEAWLASVAELQRRVSGGANNSNYRP